MDSFFWWTGAFVWASTLVAAIVSVTIGYVVLFGGDDLEERPQKRPDKRVPLDTLDM